MSSRSDLPSSSAQLQQQCVSPRQHLYKKKNSDWKTELRQKFLRHLQVGRQRFFDRRRNEHKSLNEKMLIDKIIQDEICSLKSSEHITDSELNDAIQEYEQFRDDFIQQQIEDMIINEQEQLQDLIKAEDSVLCPGCQVANLYFPDEHTFYCHNCCLRLQLTHQLPSPFELTSYFTNVFTSHADQGCPEKPRILSKNANELCLLCDYCAFEYEIF